MFIIEQVIVKEVKGDYPPGGTEEYHEKPLLRQPALERNNKQEMVKPFEQRAQTQTPVPQASL
jgi:hypothetical protein